MYRVRVSNILFVLSLTGCFAAADLSGVNGDPSKKYEWKASINSTGNETIYSVEHDTSGNYFVFGNFEGTVDFDPSSNTDNQTAPGTIAAYLTKYDKDGAYQWTKTFGAAGTTSMSVREVQTGPSREIVLYGNFNGSMDSDPSGATNTLTSNGSTDMFVIKLDSDGNHVFGYSVGNTGYDEGQSLSLNSAGDIFYSAEVQNKAVDTDLDPTGGTDNCAGVGGFDLFLTKLNANGTYAWSYCVGGTDNEWSGDIGFHSDGSILFGALFKDTVDFDPSGASVHNLTSQGNYDIALVKLDANGAFNNAVSMGGDGSDRFYSMVVDSNDNIIFVGSHNSTNMDFDLSAGGATYASAGGSDIIIGSYSGNLTFNWAHSLGAGQSDRLHDVVLGTNDTIYTVGYFGADFDIDPSSAVVTVENENSTDKDVLIAKFSNSGAYLRSWNFGGSGRDEAWSISKFGSKLLVGGNYDSSFFKLGVKELSTQSHGGATDAFILVFEE